MAKAAKKFVRTVGKCIYCGALDHLEDEHILPYGLGANMTLKDASCRACAKITGGVELHILRPIAGMLRSRLGVQTRNPELRKRIPQIFHFGDERRRIEVPPQEFPCVFSYPIFDWPGILRGSPRTGEYRTTDIWSFGQDDDFKRLADKVVAKYGASGITLGAMQPAKIMTFTAKVAHAAAVAVLGIDGFMPLLAQAAITPDQVYDDLLGGTGGTFAPNPEAIHYVSLRQLDGPAGPLIIAQIHWFWNLEPKVGPAFASHVEGAPPPFIAVVGRPVDDRLSGKLGYLEVNANGDERWGLEKIPDLSTATRVAPPDMRHRG